VNHAQRRRGSLRSDHTLESSQTRLLLSEKCIGKEKKVCQKGEEKGRANCHFNWSTQIEDVRLALICHSAAGLLFQIALHKQSIVLVAAATVACMLNASALTTPRRYSLALVCFLSSCSGLTTFSLVRRSRRSSGLNGAATGPGILPFFFFFMYFADDDDGFVAKSSEAISFSVSIQRKALSPLPGGSGKL